MIAFKPRIRRRILWASFSIILIITLALAFVINRAYQQQLKTSYTGELFNQMPLVVAELSQKGVMPNVEVWLAELDTSRTEYYWVICELRTKKTLWASERAQQAHFGNLCNELPPPSPAPALLTRANGNSYIIYQPINKDEYDPQHQLVLLRDGSAFVASMARLNSNLILYIGIFLITAALLIAIVFHWSFQPIRRLAVELKEISKGQRNRLGPAYPSELEEVTGALNNLLYLIEKHHYRYRNAMDDLAHSLKTRLAATSAILDDQSLNRDEMKRHILEQIGQMDNLVQYQLKRAMMGKRGLQKDRSLLLPVIEPLTMMMGKVYADKHIAPILDFDPAQTLPINKDDLMELLGNLLENAYRFAISHVRISVRQNGNHFRLVVEDDGPGVLPEHREKIFQRGVRADQRNPGTGIGLAVCHELVDSYHGTITVTDSSLQGAAFEINFTIES